MKKILSGILATAILTLAAASARADDAAYDIKFQRPAAVGQKFDYTANLDVSQSMLLVVGGAEAKKEAEKSTYAVEAALEITGVSDKGDPTKFHVVIKKLTAADADAAPADVAAAGTEAEGTYSEGKIDFAATKGELSDAALKALTQLFEGHDPNSKVTQDDIMGSKEQKKVGDSWAMNIKAISDSMGGVTMDPEKTKGAVKIESAKTILGTDWLEIKESVDGTDLTVPKLGAAKEAKIAVHETQLLPVDVKDPSSKSEGTRLMHAVFEAEQDGQKMTMTMDHNEKRATTSILKK